MTTRIGIQVGAVQAVRETANDAKAIAILTAIYEGMGLGPLDAPNDAKLLAVTDWMIAMLQARAYEIMLAKKQADYRQTVDAQTKQESTF